MYVTDNCFIPFFLFQYFHELKLIDKGLQTLLSRLRHDVTPEQFSGKDKRSLPRDVQQLIKEVRVSNQKFCHIAEKGNHLRTDDNNN